MTSIRWLGGAGRGGYSGRARVCRPALHIVIWWHLCAEGARYRPTTTAARSLKPWEIQRPRFLKRLVRSKVYPENYCRQTARTTFHRVRLPDLSGRPFSRRRELSVGVLRVPPRHKIMVFGVAPRRSVHSRKRRRRRLRTTNCTVDPLWETARAFWRNSAGCRTARAASKNGDPLSQRLGLNPFAGPSGAIRRGLARNTTRSIWLILPVTYACLKD